AGECQGDAGSGLRHARPPNSRPAQAPRRPTWARASRPCKLRCSGMDGPRSEVLGLVIPMDVDSLKLALARRAVVLPFSVGGRGDVSVHPVCAGGEAYKPTGWADEEIGEDEGAAVARRASSPRVELLPHRRPGRRAATLVEGLRISQPLLRIRLTRFRG